MRKILCWHAQVDLFVHLVVVRGFSIKTFCDFNIFYTRLYAIKES